MLRILSILFTAPHYEKVKSPAKKALVSIPLNYQQPTIAVATSPMATMQQQQSQNLMRSQQVQQQPVQIPLVKQQQALVAPGGTLQQQPSLAAKQLTYSAVTQPAQFGSSPTTGLITRSILLC